MKTIIKNKIKKNIFTYLNIINAFYIGKHKNKEIKYVNYSTKTWHNKYILNIISKKSEYISNPNVIFT